MMEIKHTVEILTKDIQDIEKLVRNLNNSPIPPRIELDLALSKLRHAYELLSMIRADAEQAAELDRSPAAAEAKEEPAPENPVAEEKIVGEEVVNESVADEPVIAEPVAEAPVVAVEEEVVAKEAVQAKIPLKEPEILAEKFSNDPSINENIASTTQQSDLTSKISGQPIDNIGRNIGINDRFLIIRELFDGDNESYSQMINQLDSSNGSEEALGLLKAKFPEHSDHEGYLLLSQLTRRKFNSG